jgi:hypothetical protein
MVFIDHQSGDAKHAFSPFLILQGFNLPSDAFAEGSYGSA